MTAQLAFSLAALVVGGALVTSWTIARRVSLVDRVAPGLRSRDVASWNVPTGQHWTPAVERILAPVVRDATRVIERWGATAVDVRGRLDRAGSALSVEQYRAQQVIAGLVALGVALTVSIGLVAWRGSHPVVVLVMVLAAVVAGIAVRDAALSAAIRRRQAALAAQLPTVAELLALSVAAGEGARGALERVARTVSGALADEMRRTLAEVRAGEPLARALQRLADRTGTPAVRRFADGVATAIELGTPLAEILRAQARDARESGRQELMEQGGRREIAMLVPVVFLILPITIVFALYPGLVAIDLTT